VSRERLTIDVESWPLVRVRWPPAHLSEAELDELVTLTGRCLDRCEPFGMITDGRLAPAPTAVQRKRLAEDAKKNEARLGRYMVASAVVVGSPLMKAMITAVNWLAPPPYPVQVFTEPHSAEAWVLGRLGSEAATRPARP
jgi:hypothetical protein